MLVHAFVAVSNLPALLLLVLAACGGASGPIPLERQTFNPLLAVNLAASTKTAHGAYYRDIAPGTGATVASNDGLDVDYIGQLADGTIFDASQGRGPFPFVLGVHQVIDGWDEGLVGVKVGGTRQLIIPSTLAYGDQQRGAIPPNANIVFQVIVRAAARAGPIVQSSFAPVLGVDLVASTKTLRGAYQRDIIVGNGAPVAVGQTLTVDYAGYFPDGTKFDASADHPPSFVFVFGTRTVIPGWDEGLAGVRVGGTRQLVIPSSLAYGDGGQGAVPPFATLVFSVHVISAQ